MKINAFCTADPRAALKSCDRVTFCGRDNFAENNIDLVPEYFEGCSQKTIYIPDMLDENVLGGACDFIVSENARAIVRAAYELDEAGIIEAKYKLSPIMLLHKLGVLGSCIIAGGVCLDNDDLDLMAQEGVPLIITPTSSAGCGHGYAPVCAAVRRGIRVGIGTFDGKYNPRHDLDYELEFLRITANAEMRTENALSKDELDKIAAFKI